MASILENIANIVISLSALGATFVAWRGLKSWKEQRFWEIDYKLARTLLTGLFEYRDAVKNARHPSFGYEMPQHSEGSAALMFSKQIHFNEIRKNYMKRTEKMNDVQKKLYVDLNEAKAIWGPEISNKFDTLFLLQRELEDEFRVNLEVRNPDSTEESRKEYKDIQGNGRRIMYDKFRDDDRFTLEFYNAQQRLESELRKHLGRR